MRAKLNHGTLMPIALLLVGMGVSGTVMAENVSIPCDEFVKTTGQRLACDKMPVIRMSAERWKKEKSAGAARNAPDANVPPWEREAKPQTRPAAKTLNETEPCSSPPWMRPEGAKCD